MEQSVAHYIPTIDDKHVPQSTEFEPNQKKLIMTILRITKQLWENCTNRNIYNSYERLNLLLLTNDTEVLEAVLRLLLRPAQRIPSQRSLRTGLQSVAENLKVIAFNHVYKSNKTDLKSVLDKETKIKIKRFKYQFYRPANSEYYLLYSFISF